tara:strand:- start:286 stop:1140 length:855 start_codon:yes stop_codon:yes gene_type:complete
VSKIILGTANLNQKYGFLKKSIRFSEFKKIINNSRKGVKYIDTSSNYTRAHKLLGKLDLKKIKIISKISIPIRPKINPKLWISKSIEKITSDLKVKNIYCILIHNPNILLKDEYKKYLTYLNTFKKRGIIKKIGFSVYGIKETNILLKKYKVDILQVPMNLINQSFCNKDFLKKTKKRKIEIHARSIFLQGILLSSNLQNIRYFKKWKNFWLKYYSWVDRNKITQLIACLSFIKSVKNVSGYVLGIENETQLDKILNCRTKKNLKFDKFLFQKNKKLIDPSKWH